MNVDLLVGKVEELKAARDSVARIERELVELAGGAAAPGKLPVAGPAPARVAQKDFPPEGVESLPHKLVRVVNAHPGEALTPKRVAELIGEDFRKTHASLLHRAARRGLIRKVGVGTFGALPKGVEAPAPRKRGRPRKSVRK